MYSWSIAAKSPRRLLMAAVGLFLAAVAVASCDGGRNDITVRNDTGQALVVAEVYDGHDVDVEVIEPGATGRFDSQRGSAGPLQVRNKNGEALMTIAELSTADPLPLVITESELVPNITNETDQTLVLVNVYFDWELEMARLEPGQGHAAGSGHQCFGQLVVRTLDGDEYASHDRSICPGDEWIVTAPNQ